MKKINFVLALIISINAFAQTPKYPFPHHTTYAAGTIKPNNYTQAQLDQQVKNFYDKWKTRYVKQGCVPSQCYIWYNDDGSEGTAITVSEAIGYGMVIEPLMAGYDADAKKYFDGLYNWYKSHPSSVNSALMNWQQQKSGCKSIGDDAATDGDIDAAFGLLLADKQWGSSGAINYLQAAKKIINAIKASEVYAASNALQLGDWAHTSSTYKNGTRPSDFMYDHLRCFQEATNDNTWANVLTECYSLVNNMQQNYSSTTGLIPDFIQKTDATPVPAAPNYLESKWDGNYYYNSCRTPWHLGCDFALNGDARAKMASDKINAWIKNTTGGNSHNIRGGYLLNGGNITGNNYEDLSFIAPFGVSAMVNSSNQAWLNNIWGNVIGVTNLNRDSYFGNTIKMICMIIMSGNMWAPGHLSGPEQLIAHPEDFISGETLNLFPNPSKGNIIVQFRAQQSLQLNFTVFDSNGNSVYNAAKNIVAGLNAVSIQLNNPANGIYLLKLNNDRAEKKISFAVSN